MKQKNNELKPESREWIDKHGLEKHGITIKSKKRENKKER